MCWPLFQVGAVVGFAAGAALLGVGKTAPINFVGSAALGATAGVLAHVFSRPQEQATANKMLHELKT